MKLKEIMAVTLIIAMTALVRLTTLDQVPAGLYVDEASIGYNAFSIVETGKDEYGKPFPLFFRSFATFQAPLYTYLTTIPILIFGLNIFSVRLVSALSGILLILITYFFVKKLQTKNSTKLAFLSIVVLGFSPWAIFQSRVAVEANLALTLLILSLYIFLLSLKKIIYFVPACITLAISSYAYHGQRILVFVFLAFILLWFNKYLRDHKRFVALGVGFFLLILIPQLLLSTTSGSLQRFSTQGYMQQEVFEKFGAGFKQIPLAGRYLYITRKFVAQYISSYSPRSLFFEPENQLFRSMSNLSTFYIWMIIPFFLGIKQIWENKNDPVIRLILACIVLGPLPATLTGDPFYTLRMLPMLWGLSILIAFGLFYIFKKMHLKFFKLGLGLLLIALSCFMFYTSYFILFKKERSSAFGQPYLKFAQQTEQMKDKKFLLDSEMYDAPYILMAFYKKLDPFKMQLQTDPVLLKDYYTNTGFNKYRVVENVAVKPLNWSLDPCIDQIIVGDAGTLSESQANEHFFTLVSEYKDLEGKIILWAYQTNPVKACKK
ncbi:MAG: glycosyltransferase family 39 protein [Candidatus Daviesbacteria bacterium]|nr:glycosyltransferase family 39 protein [Candidatus Daviesbacteria bacterium]